MMVLLAPDQGKPALSSWTGRNHINHPSHSTNANRGKRRDAKLRAFFLKFHLEVERQEMAAELPKRDDYEGKRFMYVQDKIKNNRKHDHLPPGHTWRIPAALAGLSLFSLTLAASATAGAAPSTPAPALKTDAAIGRALTHPDTSGWVSVIFKTKAPLTSAQEAEMTSLGADIVRRLPIIGSVTVRVPERNLAKLAALPFAAHLSLDGKVQKTDAFTVGSSGASLATTTVLSKNGKKSSTYQLTGAGITVAVSRQRHHARG